MNWQPTASTDMQSAWLSIAMLVIRAVLWLFFEAPAFRRRAAIRQHRRWRRRVTRMVQ